MRLCKRLLQTVTEAKLNFVPRSSSVRQSDVDTLQVFVSKARKLLVLTGAGISTESGIPDYRSEGVGLYARTDRRPITYQEFVRSPVGRQRYWARNFVGWPEFASCHPNIAHHSLSKWEKKGKVFWLVTQNVDSLHYKAGHKKVTELHGSTHRSKCLSCGTMMKRWDLQKLFEELNLGWHAEALEIAPDADVVLTDEQVKGFKVPSCQNCGGVLMPDVIFFGANVAKSVVNFVFELVNTCDAVLVAGSSLYVYSGYRFLQRAAEQGKDIAIINIGQTRADHLAQVKIEARCGEILPQIVVN